MRKEKNIIIAGNPEHPEVQGINGWCDNTAFIASSPEDLANFKASTAFVVSQTTLRRSTYDGIIDKLREMGVETESYDTICSATKERQDAAAKLSP